MAPLTRCRATPGTLAPNALMAEMYAARADAGLLIAEATIINGTEAAGFPNTPGCYSPAQTEGWRLVTSAVHARGGRIFLQLWHLGRAANKDLNGGTLPVAPSACEDGSWANGFGGRGGQARELTPADIQRILGEYKQGAENAKAAGFDGVELHSANGYLPNQFLSSNSNARTDAYGGSVQNRARFMEEALDACIGVFGAERVGIRLSPSSHWQDMNDADPVALYSALGGGGGGGGGGARAAAPQHCYILVLLHSPPLPPSPPPTARAAHVAKVLASKAGLAYVHVVEPRDTGLGAAPSSAADLALTGAFFKAQGFGGAVISAGGHDYASGSAYLAEGGVDAIAFGRHYIANSDLVRRFELAAAAGGAPALNAYDRSTFYASGAAGYTEGYPTLDAAGGGKGGAGAQ
jgi:N-ethylmaleimide reductase